MLKILNIFGILEKHLDYDQIVIITQKRGF